MIFVPLALYEEEKRFILDTVQQVFKPLVPPILDNSETALAFFWPKIYRLHKHFLKGDKGAKCS